MCDLFYFLCRKKTFYAFQKTTRSVACIQKAAVLYHERKEKDQNRKQLRNCVYFPLIVHREIPNWHIIFFFFIVEQINYFIQREIPNWHTIFFFYCWTSSKGNSKFTFSILLCYFTRCFHSLPPFIKISAINVIKCLREI